MGRPRIMVMSYSITVISLDERWNMWGLWTPPVHECHQRGGIHQRQTMVDEPSKRQEPRTMYERLIPLVRVQGSVRVDPEWLQTLSNTTTVKKI
jgi:hypothetical protein